MLKKIAISSFFNVLTQVIVAVLGIFLSPYIVEGLGYKNYGIFNILTLILGVSVLFDFGFSKALVKYSAEYTVNGNQKVFREIFWFTFWVQSIIGFSLSIAIFTCAQNISIAIFKTLNHETLNSIKWLAIGFPITMLISSIRGVLEGLMLFKQVNLIKLFLNSSIFIIPALCLFFGKKNLLDVIILITIIRLFVFLCSFYLLLRNNPFLFTHFNFKLRMSSNNIVSFSSWVAVTNLIVPLVGQIDKILISSILGSSFVTFYTLPLDLISGLYLIPNSIIIVLFPLFSKISHDYILLKEYAKSATKVLLFLMLPLSLIFSTFSYEFLKFWQGEIIANNSKLVLAILVLTIPLTSVSWIYSNILLALGKSRILAFNLLFQGIIFTPLLFFSVKFWGILGAVFVVFFRHIVESSIYILVTVRKIGISFIDRDFITFISSITFLLLSALLNYFYLTNFSFNKLLFVSVEIVLYVYLCYTFVISKIEKLLIKSAIKKL